jgi:hypothetical protein
MGEAKKRGTFEQRKKQAQEVKSKPVYKNIRPFRGRKAALVSSILFSMGAYFWGG